MNLETIDYTPRPIPYKNLRFLRGCSGLTIDELAILSETSGSQLTEYENDISPDSKYSRNEYATIMNLTTLANYFIIRLLIYIKFAIEQQKVISKNPVDNNVNTSVTCNEDDLNFFLSEAPKLTPCPSHQMNSDEVIIQKIKLDTIYTDLAVQYLRLRNHGLFARIDISEW